MKFPVEIGPVNYYGTQGIGITNLNQETQESLVDAEILDFEELPLVIPKSINVPFYKSPLLELLSDLFHMIDTNLWVDLDYTCERSFPRYGSYLRTRDHDGSYALSYFREIDDDRFCEEKGFDYRDEALVYLRKGNSLWNGPVDLGKVIKAINDPATSEETIGLYSRDKHSNVLRWKISFAFEGLNLKKEQGIWVPSEGRLGLVKENLLNKIYEETHEQIKIIEDIRGKPFHSEGRLKYLKELGYTVSDLVYGLLHLAGGKFPTRYDLDIKEINDSLCAYSFS